MGTAEPPHGVPTRGTRNLCFGSKIRKIGMHTGTPQFYYMKVKYKGLNITRTCYRNGYPIPPVRGKVHLVLLFKTNAAFTIGLEVVCIH